MSPQEPSIADAIAVLVAESAPTILKTVGLFVAGVVFIKSSLMDNMTPQL